MHIIIRDTTREREKAQYSEVKNIANERKRKKRNTVRVKTLQTKEKKT